jgi:hypothetical protein
VTGAIATNVGQVDGVAQAVRRAAEACFLGALAHSEFFTAELNHLRDEWQAVRFSAGIERGEYLRKAADLDPITRFAGTHRNFDCCSALSFQQSQYGTRLAAASNSSQHFLIAKGDAPKNFTRGEQHSEGNY